MDRRRWRTRQDLASAIFEWIEAFYLDVACRDVCRVLGVVTGEEVVAGRCRHPNIRDWVDAVSLNPARIPPELAGFAAVRAAKMAELAGMS